MRGRPRERLARTVPGRVLVDSGAWFALVSASDGRHDEADALFRRAREDRLWLITTNLVLAEVHRLVLFRVGIVAARHIVGEIFGAPLLKVVFEDQELHESASGCLQ